MDIEIISRENIKPSSSTPLHLRNFKFSLLDQMHPPLFHPIVLYFLPKASDLNDASRLLFSRTQILKKSLSLILTEFYPFAGIIRDSFSIDCNDGGVPFVVAIVKSQLSDFLKNPDLHLVQHFLPSELSWSSPGSNVLKIQVNQFDCGGMVIAVIVSHAVTLCTFLKSWASTARESNEEVSPNYIGQSLFPQNDKVSVDSSVFSDLMRFLIPGNYILRRYVFDSLAISTLKAKSGVENPTRVEVVTAFIWRCFMAACAAAKSGSDNLSSLMIHSVNLRRRAMPPFAEKSFGNFVWFPAAVQSINETEADLASKVRESIRQIDGDFVRRMEGDEGWIGYYKNLEETKAVIPEEGICLFFSSWCRFGVYDIDFGWGKPIWAANSVWPDSLSPKINQVTLLDTKFGDGIEAWVTIGEQFAAAFDENEELRTLTSLSQSPLEIGSRDFHL